MEMNTSHILNPEIIKCMIESANRLGIVGDVQVEVEGGTKEGDNYLGVVYGAKATGLCDGKEKSVYYILKIMHSDEAAKEFLQSTILFATEIKFYSKILPSFEEFQKRRGKIGSSILDFVPKCYGSMSDGFKDFILLEDLRVSDFWMKDRKKGLDRGECILTMRALGKLHAFSYAMKENEPETLRALAKDMIHPFFLPENRERYFKSFQRIAEQSLAAVRAHSPESAAHLESWLADGLFDGIVKICQMQEPLSVINHNDCWASNILFRGQTPEDIRLIDYQLLLFHSPAIDLLYTLYTSVQKHVRDLNYEEFLNEYHGSLTTTLRDLGTRDDILSMEMLKNHLRKYSMYGLGMSIFLVPIFYGEATDEIVNVGMGDSVSKMAWNHGVYLKQERMQRMVTELVDEFVRKGYFIA